MSIIRSILFTAISVSFTVSIATAKYSKELDSLAIFAGGIDGNGTVLRGPDASQQLVVSANLKGSDKPIDYTHQVTFSTAPEGIVQIAENGEVTPVSNGEVVVTARTISGNIISAQTKLKVAQIETPLPVNFPNEIVPLFTKFGCNGGGCHGKSGGQNGFRLSLLGFEPTEDYEWLVKESRGRRIFPASPEHSLLLLKGAGVLPHGGGEKFTVGSPEYQAIVRWIEQGTRYGEKSDPVVERIEVFPKQRVLFPEAMQQLAVTAFYSDGSTRDITRIAGFESNQKEMAEVSAGGRVDIADTTGDISVMIRFQEFVDVFQAMIPLGAPVEGLPEPRNFIDELVFTKLLQLGLPPSDVCDDSTFLRRTAIDVAGRLPTPEETSAFLTSTDPDKRSKWLDSLIDSNDYADYFANKWSAILRNKRKTGTYTRGTYAFHSWIRESLHKNKPFNEFASDIITATGDAGQHPPVAWYRIVRDRKEQLQDVAQVFLGVRLQCAECHHHPYEKWSQRDYYGFSAFFSQVGRKPGEQPEEEIVFHRPGIAQDKNPKTSEMVKPTPLGADPVPLSKYEDPRKELAAWMGAKDNDFFAHMLVNRYWKHFLGRGLVEPEDDMRVTNPATNPELLNALAQNFIASGFDLKQLVRTICSSQIYQLSAVPNDYNAGDKQNYSRYYPKRLTAEVLLDAIDGMTGISTKFAGLPAQTRAVQLPDDSFNSSSYFLTVFGRPENDSACECERQQDANLAQSLHLLNSKGIQDKLSNVNGRAASLAKGEQAATEAKIQQLYQRAFSREPDQRELQVAMTYIERKRAQGKAAAEAAAAAPAIVAEESPKKEGETPPTPVVPPNPEQEAFEDILWALINTKEFLFNH
ncbi:MAG: hypothetical protein ACI9R3_002159 [Verrucomicrobiales bacterium]|jgi:hypothetical protein